MKLCFPHLDYRLLNLKKPFQITRYKNGAFSVTLTRARPRFRSLSASGLVTSSLKFCCVSLNFVVFSFAVVYQKILLCFQKDCCVSGIFVVF